MSAIVGPIPAYTNVQINSDFYNPSRFVISGITLGETTIVTTSEDHNYVVGQLVRLVIPRQYGTWQLNEVQGVVVSLPADNEVELDIDSSDANAFVTSPYTATITNITQSNKCVVTANSSFVPGDRVKITAVSGMTELNGNSYTVFSANSTTVTLNLNSTPYTAYDSGGTMTLVNHPSTQPQTLAIGDFNSGQINGSGRVQNGTYIPGSFIDVSPN